jgi:Tol biopolymer transport system component
MRLARALDPSSPTLAAADAWCHYYARNIDGALDTVRSVPFADKQDAGACEIKAYCYLEKRTGQEALTWARRAVELSDSAASAVAALGCAQAAVGDRDGAKQTLAAMQARKPWVSPYLVALVQHALGEKSAYVTSLGRAEKEHDWWALWRNVEPRFAAIQIRTKDAVEPVRRYERALPWFAAAAVLVIAVAVLWIWFSPREEPFEQIRVAKLTTNGVANHAAISPDGKYVAYVSNEGGRPALWLRQVNASGSVRLPTPENADVARMMFSHDSLNLSFMAVPRRDPGHAVLYRLPVPGGTLHPVLRDVTGPASLSPDGTRIVILRGDPQARRDQLFVMNSDGTGERVLATRNYPERFSWPSTPMWSPDSQMILCGVESTDQKGFHVALAAIKVADGSTKLFDKPRWQFLEQANWTGDGRGFVAIGRDGETSFQQIWYVPYASGEPRKLTNDFSDYSGLTVTADSSAIVSVQMQTLTNVYVLNPRDPAHPLQITPGTGRYFDLSWAATGEILYSSDASGTADVWIMKGDGTLQRQLTSGAGRNYAPTASPSGDAVVYHSNRSGNWNLWQMHMDGSEAKQLTFGTKDSNWPRFTPDGQWVVYHHTGENGMFNVFKLPIGGGEPQQIADKLSMYPAVSPVASPDGVRIACWYSEDVIKPAWRLAVMSLNNGTPSKTFEMPATVYPDTVIRWTPDGRGITYIDNNGGAANLWTLPIDGGSPRQVTSFTWGQIYSFDWSRDGRLAYSRGLSTSDAVILRDVRAK